MAQKTKPRYKRIAQLKTADDLRSYLVEQNIDLQFDEELMTGDQSPYRQSYTLRSGDVIGNRFCILPMEGWDGTTDGKPTEFTKHRWKNFAHSGAKLIWGCEAFAVRDDARANPNQLVAKPNNQKELDELHNLLIAEHEKVHGNSSDLYIGLQLTHSGRFCKPNDNKTLEPKIAYHHPLLDKKFGISDDYPPITDEALDRLIEDFVSAAVLAQKAGFHFVDIKHCHGYLGHEILSGFDRPGKYGGSFENRTRFLNEIVAGIKAEASGLNMGVRLSAFDWMPFVKDENDVGIPSSFEGAKYPFAFGGDGSGLGVDLTETFKFVELLETLGIELVCVTLGSPYYNPHIQRPALFPPSDGYLPPEDPLAGVARQIKVTGEIKKAFPNMTVVGSAYSYLQEWLPNVGQYILRHHMSDFIGLGRMVLSYPELPADVLGNLPLKRGKLCRTFSDCTTAPRNGIRSGCYPLDPFYKQSPEFEKLKQLKS